MVGWRTGRAELWCGPALTTTAVRSETDAGEVGCRSGTKRCEPEARRGQFDGGEAASTRSGAGARENRSKRNQQAAREGATTLGEPAAPKRGTQCGSGGSVSDGRLRGAGAGSRHAGVRGRLSLLPGGHCASRERPARQLVDSTILARNGRTQRTQDGLDGTAVGASPSRLGAATKRVNHRPPRRLDGCCPTARAPAALPPKSPWCAARVCVSYRTPPCGDTVAAPLFACSCASTLRPPLLRDGLSGLSRVRRSGSCVPEVGVAERRSDLRLARALSPNCGLSLHRLRQFRPSGISAPSAH